MNIKANDSPIRRKITEWSEFHSMFWDANIEANSSYGKYGK